MTFMDESPKKNKQIILEINDLAFCFQSVNLIKTVAVNMIFQVP